MRAVLFPGQGSQYVGMGSDFYKKFDSTKKLFKIVDKTLGFSLSNIILNGPESELKLTQNTQPAIMTVGVCIFNVLNQEFGLNLNNTKFFAGHSLGEYTALACAEGLSFSETLKILKIRGNAMQSAVPKGEGGMVAVLGSDIEQIEKIIKENKNKYDTLLKTLSVVSPITNLAEMSEDLVEDIDGDSTQWQKVAYASQLGFTDTYRITDAAGFVSNISLIRKNATGKVTVDIEQVKKSFKSLDKNTVIVSDCDSQA